MEPHLAEMFRSDPLLIPVIFLWDPHHIQAWEDKVLAWGRGDQVQDIQSWKDQAQDIHAWKDQAQNIQGVVDQVQVILEWLDQVLATHG